MSTQILKKKGGGTPLLDVISSLRTNLTERGNEFSDATKGVVSMEGMDTATPAFANLQHNFESAQQIVKDAFGTAVDGRKPSFESLSEAQIDAGAIALLANANPSLYAQNAYKMKNTVSTESLVVVEPTISGIGGSLDYRNELNASLEAFSEQELKQHIAFSIAYNVQAARQDEFSEAFYPTTVVTPDQAGLDITVRQIVVFNEVRHKLNGKTLSFNRTNLIDAVIDASILANESTKLVPHYVTGPDGNTDNFVPVASVPSTVVKIDGFDIPTGALIVSKSIGLIGVSQHAGLLGAGILDHTDTVDARANLDTLYVQFGGEATDPASVVPFKVSRLPRSGFNKSVEGNFKEMSLQFTTADLTLSSDTKDVANAAPADDNFDVITTNNLRVKLAVKVSGTLNTEIGDVNVWATKVEVAGVYDEDGTEVSVASGIGAAAVAQLGEISVLGYTLDARRNNENRRTRGLQVDSTEYTERFTIPFGPPVSTPAPVGSNRDASDMTQLITTTRIRNSNNAVTTLLNYAEVLKATVAGINGNMPVPQIEGIGRLLIKRPFYEEVEVNVMDQINSTKSHERAVDVQGILVNVIRDVAYRMYQESGYQPALDALTGGDAAKPTLLIGTDQQLVRHLMIEGDSRTTGIGLDSKIVVSADSRVRYNIYLTFTRPEQTGPDPLSFGTHAWMPELASAITVSRNGANIKEAMVQPRSRHINNLPILAVIKVDAESLKEALSLKTETPPTP